MVNKMESILAACEGNENQNVSTSIMSRLLEELYATHLLAIGFLSGSVMPSRFCEIDPREEDMLTTTLECFLRSKGKKCTVVRKGPRTFTFKIMSYSAPVLHRHNSCDASFKWKERNDNQSLHIQTTLVHSFVNACNIEK